ncbi:MAG TPA: ATP-binding protein [Steroidobacteraceae bacterium]
MADKNTPQDFAKPLATNTPLVDREATFARLLNGIRDCAIYMLDTGGYVTSWNAGAERIKGYGADEIIGKHFSEFYTPEDRATGLPGFAMATAARIGKFEGEGWRVRKDGSRFWANVLIDAIREGDHLVGFAKITRDMTERQAMQEQLHQSQKMEAVGQLTGGVAHDFNNLLTVILGNLDTLSQQIPAEHARWRRAVDQAMRASERAANLTQQLLAFARRQPLKPKPVDVNRLLSRWSELVRRTLPESISLRHIEDSHAGSVEVDQNQLESALLNLAVNARDAMPGGGTLTIETARTQIQGSDIGVPFDLQPGDYVLICMSDTGTGMSKEVLERAFEPFFTTKPLGQGTGLGLSQVFGFVKQSGGNVKLYSRPGHGTTIKIFLRRMSEQALAEEDIHRELAVTGKRHESILVVEDNAGVRSFSADSLRDYGFNVLEASDASEAMGILEGKTTIDLLFTDIGLPGLSGRELVCAVQRKHPNIRILFTSGYAQMPSPTDSRWMSDAPLLSKPFTRSQLFEKVLQVLDAV